MFKSSARFTNVMLYDNCQKYLDLKDLCLSYYPENEQMSLV